MKKILQKEVIFHIVFIVIIVCVCCSKIKELNYPYVLNDEFGYWGNAASFAGYDWKSLIAETPYYAWGYSIWLIPCISLLPTFALRYKAAILLNVSFLVISYILCSITGKKIFPKNNKLIIDLVSLVVILYPSNIIYSQFTWTESLLYLLMWIATYLVVSLEKEFSYKKFIFLVITLLYMYIVHSRTIGITIAGLICLLLILIKHKKKTRYFVLALAIFILGYCFNNTIKGYQITEFWGNSSNADLNNVSINQQTFQQYASMIIGKFNSLLGSLGGKLIYLLVGTGLAFSIGVIKILQELINNVKEKKWFERDLIYKLWCLLSIIFMWGICSLQMLNWIERKDIIVYSRYMENALGPILFLCIMYLITCKKIARWSSVISIVVIMVGIRSVYWRISEANGRFNTVCSPIFGVFYEDRNYNIAEMFEYIFLMCCIALGIIIICSFIKNTNITAIIIITTFGVSFLSLANKGNDFVSRGRSETDMGIVTIAEEIMTNYNQRDIYYVKDKDLDVYSFYAKYLQFMIPEKTVNVIDKEELDNFNINDKSILVVNAASDVKMDNFSMEYETKMLQLFSYCSN